MSVPSPLLPRIYGGAVQLENRGGGARIESEILDLRDSPDLRDIRGINGDHVAVHLHPGAVSKLWHLCKMGNFRLTGIIIGNEAPSETFLSRFTKLRECWISYSPLFRTVHITNANADLYSLWLSGCGVETLDLENQTQVTHVEVDNNPLNEVNLAGCSNLVYLLMNNCNLSQVMIDGIITDLYGCLPENSDAGNQISLDGSNAPPSDSGMAFVTILRSRGWNIVINEPSE